MENVNDVYNKEMYNRAMELPVYKAAPNISAESKLTQDRKSWLSHPMPNNISAYSSRKIEGAEIGTIDESLMKLYNQVNNVVVKSSPPLEEKVEEREDSGQKEGFRRNGDCGCSAKHGDKMMFKIYMGSMTIVGLFILYRALQKN